MNRFLVGLSAILLSCTTFGCSGGTSEAEIKKGQEEMQKQNEEMSKALPAKID